MVKVNLRFASVRRTSSVRTDSPFILPIDRQGGLLECFCRTNIVIRFPRIISASCHRASLRSVHSTARGASRVRRRRRVLGGCSRGKGRRAQSTRRDRRAARAVAHIQSQRRSHQYQPGEHRQVVECLLTAKGYLPARTIFAARCRRRDHYASGGPADGGIGVKRSTRVHSRPMVRTSSVARVALTVACSISPMVLWRAPQAVANCTWVRPRSLRRPVTLCASSARMAQPGLRRGCSGVGGGRLAARDADSYCVRQ